MSTGPSNFDYTDDSVIAKISVDVPHNAVTDIAEIAHQTQALRVEMEALARAQGDYSSYISSLPEIMQRATQQTQSYITQLERVSYIQNELGGGMGNVGMQTGMPSGGGGGGVPPGQTYNTAAPAGYVNPFMGMQSGLGIPNQASPASYMQGLAMQDPRLFANMAAARGMPVNPADLGLTGGNVAAAGGAAGGTGGGQGRGAAAPGSQSPQSTQGSRDSSAPPDPSQSGQGSRAEPQNIPTEPHPDAPEWQKQAARLAQNIAAESAPGGRSLSQMAMGGAANWLGQGAGGRMGGIPPGGGPPGGGGGGGGAGGSGGGGRIASGMGWLGKGVANIQAANRNIQNAGEVYSQYEQLGSVQGGGAMAGAGMEAQARLMGMNPFITTEQARQLMQKALSSGYRGDQADNVIDMMSGNLRQFGMSYGETMDLVNEHVRKTTGTAEEFGKGMTGLQETLAGMKADAAEGGMALPERIAQLKKAAEVMGPLGISPEAVQDAARMGGQMYPGNEHLSRVMMDKSAGAMTNPAAAMMMAQQYGLKGVVPGAVPSALAEKGVNMAEASQAPLRQMAQQLKRAGGNKHNQAWMLTQYANSIGYSLDMNDALQLMGEGGITDEQSPGDRGRQASAEGAKKGPSTSIGGRISDAMGAFSEGNVLTSPFRAIGNFFQGSTETERQGMKSDERIADSKAPKTRDAAPVKVNTEGKVSGEVKITVDQQGRVTNAPRSIQLSGHQRGVNAGQGAATMNNPGAGENHSGNGWGGGR